MAGGVNRRTLFRAALAAGAAAGMEGAAEGQQPMPGQTADSRMNPGAKMPDLAAADWKPVFLDAHQSETLEALADRIIPETDTPGAKAAQAHRFIDLLLSAESTERQRSFVHSLSFIDGESQRRYGAAFAALGKGSQTELLELIAYPLEGSGWTGEGPGDDPGHRHFENLKGWISEAFYSSEMGRKSLGWDGNVIHGPYTGCEKGPKEG